MVIVKYEDFLKFVLDVEKRSSKTEISSDVASLAATTFFQTIPAFDVRTRNISTLENFENEPIEESLKKILDDSGSVEESSGSVKRKIKNAGKDRLKVVSKSKEDRNKSFLSDSEVNADNFEERINHLGQICAFGEEGVIQSGDELDAEDQKSLEDMLGMVEENGGVMRDEGGIYVCTDFKRPKGFCVDGRKCERDISGGESGVFLEGRSDENDPERVKKGGFAGKAIGFGITAAFVAFTLWGNSNKRK